MQHDMENDSVNKNVTASALHDSAIIIDGCAPILRDCDNAGLWIEGGATCGLATVALHDDSRSSTLDLIGRLYRQIRDRDDVVLARGVDDILAAKKAGRFAIVLAFQSSAALDQRVDMVGLYYRLGVLSMNLAYNQAEAAADGCMEPRNGGLTRFGRQVVAEMNRVGMLLDLSHTGHRATMEAMDLSTAPVAFTHSDAKALYDHPRNVAVDTDPPLRGDRRRHRHKRPPRLHQGRHGVAHPRGPTGPCGLHGGDRRDRPRRYRPGLLPWSGAADAARPLRPDDGRGGSGPPTPCRRHRGLTRWVMPATSVR